MTEQQSRRWRTAVALVVTAAASMGGGVLLAVTAVRADTETDRANQAVAVVEELCEQVRTLGGLCLVDADDFDGRDVTSPSCPPPPASWHFARRPDVEGAR